MSAEKGRIRYAIFQDHGEQTKQVHEFLDGLPDGAFVSLGRAETLIPTPSATINIRRTMMVVYRTETAHD